MASSSQKVNESRDVDKKQQQQQKKKALLRSNDQVVVDGASEAKKRKTGAAKGSDKEGAKKKEQQQAKRKRPARAAATAARTRSQLDERAEDPSPVALLDMLAEVASATLKNDPSIRTQLRRRRKLNARSNMRQTRSSSTTTKKTGGGILRAAKPQRRSTQPEQLSLDQIRMLSDKLLLNMFAEMTADEIRRNYTYSCFLLPEKCLQKYTSFGNENRARMQMKTHLLGHIAELLSEANTAGRSSQKGKFTAEPVTARKRRLAVEQECARSSRRRGGTARKGQSNAASNSQKTGGGSGTSRAARGKSQAGKKVSKTKQTDDDEDDDDEEDEKDGRLDRKKPRPTPKNGVTSSRKALKEPRKPNLLSDGMVVEKAAPPPAHGVQTPICYEHPMHDHCYTTVDGGKNLPDHYDDDEDDSVSEEDGEDDEEDVAADEGEEEEADPHVKVVGEPDLRKGLVVFTNLEDFNSRDRTIDDIQTTFRSKQAEMALRQLEAIRQLQMQKNRKVTTVTYAIDASESARPSQSDARPNLRELEDELMDSDCEEKQALDTGSPEWERRLALKCIRMLRTKKKDEHVPLVCKICKGKSFTAQATLMYHYRSHAGIKPFLCNICNTTFTRQHSLNYHMLIHNNKSRFTCGDCGRKFRHPSHFKEHMRRHTGETPFECSDCGVRFKTRNTYKRHLKTRHGKLLTVNGIMMLTNEEFLKVKTNPKKKQLRLRKDKETQWPETMTAPTTTSLNLKSIAMSNIPLMADIDSEVYLQTDESTAVRVHVVAEPSSHDLTESIDVKNFIDNEPMLNEGSEGNGVADGAQFTCISIGVGTEGPNSEQNIIFLEALPIESPKGAILEGGTKEEEEQGGGHAWHTDESVFSDEAEAMQAAVVLQPILQCM